MIIACGSIIHSDMRAPTHSFSKDTEGLPQAGPYVGLQDLKMQKTYSQLTRTFSCGPCSQGPLPSHTRANNSAGETNMSSLNATPHAWDSNRGPESERCKGGTIWPHVGRSRPPGEMHSVFKGEQELARWTGRGNTVCQGREA